MESVHKTFSGIFKQCCIVHFTGFQRFSCSVTGKQDSPCASLPRTLHLKVHTKWEVTLYCNVVCMQLFRPSGGWCGEKLKGFCWVEAECGTYFTLFQGAWRKEKKYKEFKAPATFIVESSTLMWDQLISPGVTHIYHEEHFLPLCQIRNMIGLKFSCLFHTFWCRC